METFKSIIRPVGNSFCVILPKNVMNSQKLKKGEEIEVAIMPKRKVSLKDLFGTLKGTKPFVREHDDRVF
ncbi:Uncharacterised protein [Candidatus Burarchaeum australiense]|nr:Uncharacterised protein [Candidatus Burarchaeum australiense]